ncbi:MAG: shikimate dehydrogenase family protein [Bacteroidia bacterium]
MSLYGLIGKTLDHSKSPELFSQIFKTHKISNAEYKLFPLKAVKAINKLLKEQPNLLGFNVTFPFKTDILPFLYEIDKTAVECWAVNTVKVTTFKNRTLLKGFNTDMPAFKESIEKILPSNHNKALIFGTGGAANAAKIAFNHLGIEFSQVSRQQKFEYLSYSDLNESIYHSHNILVNCTPVGTYPKVKDCLPIDFEFIGENHLIYDMVYNPTETELIKKARSQGAQTQNGLEMLQLQAEKAWDIWQH